MPLPRILLCDDHALIIEGLRTVLKEKFEIVGVTANGREVVTQTELLKPDAVLLDISMPLLNGIEAARQIKKSVPSVKLVFVTQKADREYVNTALRIGAYTYVLKQSLVSELIPALREALEGRFYVTPLRRNGIPDVLVNPHRNPSELFGGALTTRQREVLQLVAEGQSIKETAAILSISVKTVDFHKSRLMEELGLHTTAELTRYALEYGILT